MYAAVSPLIDFFTLIHSLFYSPYHEVYTLTPLLCHSLELAVKRSHTTPPPPLHPSVPHAPVHNKPDTNSTPTCTNNNTSKHQTFGMLN